MCAMTTGGSCHGALLQTVLAAAGASVVSTLATWWCLQARSRSRVTRNLPKRILIVRHGESEGNVDKKLYEGVADHQLVLTQRGEEQARDAGRRVKAIVGDEDCHFYVSPFERTLLTYMGLASQLTTSQNCGLHIDARLREQEWGNFQTEAETEQMERERDIVGNYFYRFRTGESGADVGVRIGSFFASFYRRCERRDYSNANVVIVAHGLTNRAILSKFFRWTPRVYDNIKNPKNGEVWTLVRDAAGKYTISEEHMWEDTTAQSTLKRWRGAPIVYKKVRLHLIDGRTLETVVNRFYELSSAFIVEHEVKNFDPLYALIKGNDDIVAQGIAEADIDYVNMLYTGICDGPSSGRGYTMLTTSFKVRHGAA